MSKQYGLILPGQFKKAPGRDVGREFTKPAIFDESSSASDDNGPPQMLIKKAPIGPSLMEKRKAKNLQDRALAEDPTIFQYDELFDEMESKREEEKLVKSNEPKKVRYVTKLMEAAERRKLENELRVERQVQKEREAEGEEFKDKEAFVTSAYRKKLEEMRKLEMQNKRDDYLEAIGDVTKQKDLDGFYRHIYEQKTSTLKCTEKPELQANITSKIDSCIEEVAYKPINSGKIQKQRAYRKRKSSDEENEDDGSVKEDKPKKVHLTNNIDADSDFSIDDSSTGSEDEEYQKECKKNCKTNETAIQHSAAKADECKQITNFNAIALNLESLKSEQQNENKLDIKDKDKKLPIPAAEFKNEDLSPPKQKRDKTDVWRKRTVGDVYIAAVQRYYERKALRNQA